MNVPIAVLLGFAGWTIFLLAATIGVYRWSHILTGRARIDEFRADDVQGADWYRRAMRAHANCVENLPVYGAITMSAFALGVSGPWMDACAVTLMVARIAQSTVHVAFVETPRTVGVRFTFFSVQLAAMAVMGIGVALRVYGT